MKKILPATEAAAKETEKETTAEAASRNIDVTYVGDGKLPIVKAGGKRYFDFTADDFLNVFEIGLDFLYK